MEVPKEFIIKKLLTLNEFGGKFTYWDLNEKKIDALYKHPSGLKVGFIIYFGKYRMFVFAKNYKLVNTKNSFIDIIEFEVSSDKKWDNLHIKPDFYENYDFKSLVKEFSLKQ